MIESTLRFEGARSNHTWDPGGHTMYGLSAKYNPAIAREIIDGTLTRDQAIAYIYRTYLSKFEKISSKGLLFYVFDATFSGHRYAVAVLQGFVNVVAKVNLEVDGKCGPKTTAALNALTPDQKEKVFRLLELSANEVGSAQANYTSQYTKGVSVAKGYKNRQRLRVDAMRSFDEQSR